MSAKKNGERYFITDMKYFGKILLKTPEFFLIGIMWNIGILTLFYLLKFKEVAPFVMVLGIVFLASSYFISTFQYFNISQNTVFEKEVLFLICPLFYYIFFKQNKKLMLKLIVFCLFGIGMLNILPLINYRLLKENFMLFQGFFYACEILTIYCANQMVNFRWAQYVILPQLM